MNLMKVTASVPLNTFCKVGIVASMLLRTLSVSKGEVAAVIHVKSRISSTRACWTEISISGDKSLILSISRQPSGWLTRVRSVCSMS